MSRRRFIEFVNKVIRSDVFWLVLILIFIFLLRLQSATEVVIDWDESVYFTIAQDAVNGGGIYETAWDHKGPVLFFIFMPVIKLFENFGNILVILRIFTTIYLLVSMFFIYLIARELFGKGASLASPLAYGIFFMNFGGLASNGELFMMLPAILAMFCFVKYMKESSHPRMLFFLCGFFSASAILIKQTAFFSIVLFPIVLIFKKFSGAKYGWKRFAGDIFFYALGGLVLSGLVLSYFISHDSVGELYHVLFRISYEYVSFVSFPDAIDKIYTFFKDTVSFDLVTILSCVSLLIILKRDAVDQRRNYYFIIGLLMFSILGVFWARQMYPHYYLQMGMPFALMIAFAISEIKINVTYFDIDKVSFLGAMLVVIVAASVMPAFLYDYKNYRDNELYNVSDYIRERTTGEDKIFVVGGQPIIYFLSNRTAPTKYFFWIHHIGKWNESLLNEDYNLQRFNATKPKYIVFDKSRGHEVEYLEKFMNESYQNETEISNSILFIVNEAFINESYLNETELNTTLLNGLNE